MSAPESRGNPPVHTCSKRRIILATTILLAALSSAPGQTPQNHASRADNDEEARRQVLATDDKRMQALRQGDPEPVREIYADDYTLITPSGVVRSKEEQINDLVSGRVRYKKIEIVNRTIRVYGDVAIVLSRDKYDSRSRAPPWTILCPTASTAGAALSCSLSSRYRAAAPAEDARRGSLDVSSTAPCIQRRPRSLPTSSASPHATFVCFPF
jgi:hypothetical protein